MLFCSSFLSNLLPEGVELDLPERPGGLPPYVADAADDAGLDLAAAGGGGGGGGGQSGQRRQEEEKPEGRHCPENGGESL